MMRSREVIKQRMQKVGVSPWWCGCKPLIAVATMFLLLVGSSYAETIVAVSPSSAHIQAAIDAAADGDTVTVPAGSATWSGNVRIPNTKGITLRGAGIGETVINLSGKYIDMNTAEGNSPVRITGFTLRGGPSSTGLGAIAVNDNDIGAKNWRIDHIRFEYRNNGPYNGIITSGWTWGLVDNCHFEETPRGLFIRMGLDSNTDPLYYGDYSWMQPSYFGGSQAVYVEDCTFHNTWDTLAQAVEAQYGCRFVFRYNTVTGYFGVDNHSGCTLGSRNPRHAEIYENTFRAEGYPRWRAIILRGGGTAVVFNNTIEGHENAIHMDYEMGCRTNCSDPWASANTDSYPAQDQIGRGQDSGWGTSQAHEPWYEWGNTFNGSPTHFEINPYFDSCSIMTNELVVEGRDYFQGTEMPGYEPLAYPHPLSDPVPQPPQNLRLGG